MCLGEDKWTIVIKALACRPLRGWNDLRCIMISIVLNSVENPEMCYAFITLLVLGLRFHWSLWALKARAWLKEQTVKYAKNGKLLAETETI